MTNAKPSGFLWAVLLAMGCGDIARDRPDARSSDLASPAGDETDLGLGGGADLELTGSCDDGIKNGGESDVDCGGIQCDPCAVGKACLAAGDCRSGVCTAGLCKPKRSGAAISFAPEVSYPTGFNPMDITAADFRGIGRIDIATADQGAKKASFLLGLGNGTFGAANPLLVDGCSCGIAAGDFNQDGRADLAVNGGSASGLRVFLSAGKGGFDAGVDLRTGVGAFSVAVLDVNGDRKPDLVTANGFDRTVSVLIGRGDGTFADKVDYAVCVDPVRVAAADFNGDQRTDLVVVCGQIIDVLTGKGGGTFNPSVRVWAAAFGFGSDSVLTGDFNRDGKWDFALAGDSKGVSVHLGNGDNTFQPPRDFAAGGDTTALFAADFDGDDILDIATLLHSRNKVAVLGGVGDGTFRAALTFPLGFETWVITGGDFNLDGKVDLAVANIASTVGVLLNNQ